MKQQSAYEAVGVAFIDHRLSIDEFEAIYYALFANHIDMTNEQYDVLQKLWGDIEEYTPDPVLREQIHGSLDEDGVRDYARIALNGIRRLRA